MCSNQLIIKYVSSLIKLICPLFVISLFVLMKEKIGFCQYILRIRLKNCLLNTSCARLYSIKIKFKNL